MAIIVDRIVVNLTQAIEPCVLSLTLVLTAANGDCFNNRAVFLNTDTAVLRFVLVSKIFLRYWSLFKITVRLLLQIENNHIVDCEKDSQGYDLLSL